MGLRNLTDDTRLMAPEDDNETAGAVTLPDSPDEVRDMVREAGDRMGLGESPEDQAEDDGDALESTEVTSEETEVHEESPVVDNDPTDEVRHDDEYVRFAKERMGWTDSVIDSVSPEVLEKAVTERAQELWFPQQQAPPPQMAPPPVEQPGSQPEQPTDHDAAVASALEKVKEEGYGDEISELITAMQAQSQAKQQALEQQMYGMQQHFQQQGERQFQGALNQLIDGLGNAERYGTEQDWSQAQMERAQMLQNEVVKRVQAGEQMTPLMVKVLDERMFGGAGTPSNAVQESKARALKTQSRRRGGVGSKAAAPREDKFAGSPDDNPKLHALWQKLAAENGRSG